MKKLLFLIMFMFLFVSVGNANELKPNLDIIMQGLEFEGDFYDWEVGFKYNSEKNAWDLWYVDEGDRYPELRAYGFDKEEFINEINRYRAEGAPCSTGGKSPVTWDDALAEASLGHSADMAINNYFSHYSQDGTSPWTRIREAGFTGQAMGENIATGQTCVQSVVKSWINSPGHCRNIMNSMVNVMGYAWAQKTSIKYHTMATGRK